VSEYLSEEEQLAQLKSWWQGYGWWIVLAVVLGLVGYFALEYMRESAKAHNAAASEVFERYQQNMTDEAAAKPLLARLDGEYAGTPYQLLSLLARAQQAADSDDIEGAVGFYESAVASAEVEHLTDVARLRLARSQQALGRSEDAFATLASVKGEGYRSLVAELKGDILRAQGKMAEAREAYAAAVDAEGETPRTLSAMKLADLSAPEGALQQESSADPQDEAVMADEASELTQAAEEVVETLEGDTVPEGDLTVPADLMETIENEAAPLESNATPALPPKTVNAISSFPFISGGLTRFCSRTHG